MSSWLQLVVQIGGEMDVGQWLQLEFAIFPVSFGKIFLDNARKVDLKLLWSYVTAQQRICVSPNPEPLIFPAFQACFFFPLVELKVERNNHIKLEVGLIRDI